MTAADTRLGQGEVDADQQPDDLTLWSVTTILGALDKPALLYWSAEQTAEAAIDNQRTWQAMLEDRGRGEAVKWLRDARFRRPKDRLSAADLGTVVHACCEQYALSGTRPGKDDIAQLVRLHGGEQADVRAEGPVVFTMLDRFDEWLQRFTPKYEATEVTVYEPDFGWAGTADGFVVLDGMRLLIDYKSSREPFDSQGKPKTPYPEQVGLQLAAYRHAKFAAVWRPRRTEKFRRRYYLLNASERAMAVPVPETDGALVIQITTEDCSAFPIRADDQVYRYFLNLQEVYRWLQDVAPTVMRDPLVSERDS